MTDISDTKDAIVELRLFNLELNQSIQIQNKDLISLFPNALSVSIKREFKKNEGEDEVLDIEALSLEEFFLAHIKDENKNNSDDKKLKSIENKVKELFSLYERSE